MELRVAFIIGGLGIGGAERHLVNLVNAMSCDYRAVICAGPKPSGPSFHDDLDPDIEQYFLRVRHRSMPLGVLRLASILKQARVTVVHTHMYHSNLYGTVAARLAGIPVVVTTEHGENPWKRPYQWWLERNVISPIADVRFCVSPQILAIRRDVDGIPATKLRLVVNGTLVPPISSQRAPNRLPVIGAVGRFIPAKDFPRLLEAVAELQRLGYRFELNIVGDGPEKENALKVVEELCLGDIVKMPGMVTDIERWYERFDIYVSSSVREGQPVAMLEAMAHGLPVVATDVGAAAATVRHGEGGLIVPAGDSMALAKALGRLLDDCELRETLGQNARARIEQEYSVNAVADFHMKCYRDLLSQMKDSGR